MEKQVMQKRKRSTPPCRLLNVTDQTHAMVKELAHDLNTPIVDVVETLINFAISQVEIVVEYEDD